MSTVLIVGCGNMGGAMLTGWLAAGFDPARFTIVDPFLGAAPEGVELLREVPVRRFDTVLLGVKPQLLDEAAPTLEPAVGPETALYSILAGVELASLAARFPRAGTLIRVMPNLAAALGKSPIALFGNDLSDAARNAAEALMIPLGMPEWLASEGQFDMVTALAGSGPAFLYRFIAALAEGAEGLDPVQARRLAVAMAEGAAALAAQSDADPGELARRVASPGGTTAAGLAVLDTDGALQKLLAATLAAARERGAQLAAAAR